MHIQLRIAPALIGACLALLASAAPVLAAAPATVSVRVEGLTETRLPATTVTTTEAPVIKDGNPAHACSGTSALGALELATAGDWSGPWNSGFGQYEVLTIEGETHLFEPTSQANYFWSLWVDEKESEVGACEAQLSPGDRVLLFPSCFGSECPPPVSPLGAEAPASANVGAPVTVTVKRFKSSGEAEPAAGATVSGGSAPALTDAAGHAEVTFAAAGSVSLSVTRAESVRTETTLCVHSGNDGTCGTTSGATGGAETTASTSSGGSSGSGGVATFRASSPGALIAQTSGLSEGRVYARGHAPRLIAGAIQAPGPVATLRIELRRRYEGRCFAYEGARERFVRSVCGKPSYFAIAGGSSFSYLLPFALPAGRYVFDIQATDAAGASTRLERGRSRIVFYVR